MRTVKRNSRDVKAEIEHLWEDRNAWVAEQIRKFPTKMILEAVANAHGFGVTALRSPARNHPLCMARHHAVWELRRRRLDLSFRQIAAELDRINQATAVHSWQVFCDLVRRGMYAAERAAVDKELGGQS